MAKCYACGSFIFFGGIKDEGRHFCNQQCHTNGYALEIGQQIPVDVLAEQILAFHASPCPRCQGPGPIDVYTSHSVWSLIWFSSWKSTPQVCCRPCGRKSQWWGVLSSTVLGWWGIPWGIIMTPVQIGRNLAALSEKTKLDEPSAAFSNMVRVHLAAQIAQARQVSAQAGPARGGPSPAPEGIRAPDKLR